MIIIVHLQKYRAIPLIRQINKKTEIPLFGLYSPNSILNQHITRKIQSKITEIDFIMVHLQLLKLLFQLCFSQLEIFKIFGICL